MMVSWGSFKKFHRLIVLGILFSSLGASSSAESTEENQSSESPTLMFRSGYFDAYHAHPFSFPMNATPVTNDHGDLAIRIVASKGSEHPALWVKPLKLSQTSARFQQIDIPEAFTLWDVRFEGRDVEFGLIDKSYRLKGIYRLKAEDYEKQRLEKIVAGNAFPHRGSLLSHLRVKDSLVFLTHIGPDYYVEKLHLPTNTWTTLLHSEEDNVHQLNFIYSLEKAGDKMVFQVSKGKWGDNQRSDLHQIWLMDLAGDWRVLREAQRENSEIALKSISNRINTNQRGELFYYADYRDGQKCLNTFSVDADVEKKLLCEKDSNLRFEPFFPVGNDRGDVAFRAFDELGNRVIFHYYRLTKKLKKLVTDQSVLESDLGPLQIYAKERHPGFGGGLSINNRREVFFNTSIGDTQELYSKALYKVDLAKINRAD